jgi:hypothetical protein
MSKTPFSNKVEMLGQMWLFYKQNHGGDQGWSDFFEFADIGLPMSYMAWQGYITIKPDAKRFVEEVWDTLCEMLDVDPESKYDSLDALMQASPNEPLYAEG